MPYNSTSLERGYQYVWLKNRVGNHQLAYLVDGSALYARDNAPDDWLTFRRLNIRESVRKDTT